MNCEYCNSKSGHTIECVMKNYFVSYAVKYKDINRSAITHYGNIVIELPHTINDNSDIIDLQEYIKKLLNIDDNVVILYFKRLPE